MHNPWTQDNNMVKAWSGAAAGWIGEKAGEGMKDTYNTVDNKNKKI